MVKFGKRQKREATDFSCPCRTAKGIQAAAVGAPPQLHGLYGRLRIGRARRACRLWGTCITCGGLDGLKSG